VRGSPPCADCDETEGKKFLQSRYNRRLSITHFDTDTRGEHMPVETPSFFAQVIQDHLELKRRNAELEPAMPLNRYRADDPFDNHPLFKTEEQARIEDTMDGQDASPVATKTLKWPGEDPDEQLPEIEQNLWSQSRDFDWGD
jgi:hypothetical protein